MTRKTILTMLAFMGGVCLSTSCNQAPKNNPETTITALPDNATARPMSVGLFTDVSDSLVQALGIAEGIPSSMCAYLLETEGKQILFDSGNGVEDSQLLPLLEKKGISAEDIDYIFITHLHGDHIGGLVKDGKAVFGKAKLYINAKELETWLAMPEEQNAQARSMAEAYKEQLITFDVNEALPHGIQPIAAYGHTEGHTVYRKEDLIIVGDIMHGVALQMVNPNSCARFDGNQEKSAETRKAIIDYAKQEKLMMYGMHFPEPYYLDFKE